MTDNLLINFSGLPGTGKTTLARLVSQRLNAVYLRVDTVEHALVECGIPGNKIEGKGYVVCYRLATDNLAMGRTVVADTVNPWNLTRKEWQEAAAAASRPYLDIEVVCSDIVEHRRRVESRRSDIPGFVVPTWQEVIDRDYEPWETDRVVIDTATRTPDEAIEIILAKLESPGL